MRPYLTYILISLVILLIPVTGYGRITSHRIDVKIEPDRHSITLRDSIRFEGRKPLRLYLNSESRIRGVYHRDKPIPYKVRTNRDRMEIIIPLKDGIREVTVSYKSRFPSMADAKEGVRGDIAFASKGVIDREGIFLPESSGWYPKGKQGDLSIFLVEVVTPHGYETILEGELLGKKGLKNDTLTIYKTEGPIDGINLVSGRYLINKETYRGIDIMTYLFKEDSRLSRRYIDGVKHYLDLFEPLFGRYPFKKFAVVENLLPTGYGMASFTLLGRDVIRLPFIVKTSLGHEVAHNWWGNSVFLNPSMGNWLEALTTYVADYHFAELKGEKEAEGFRRDAVVKYNSTVTGDNEIPLKRFLEPVGAPERAVGYNKGMMVFHMLRRIVGNRNFFKALKSLYRDRAFKRASWMDLEEHFEKTYGRDLSWFFDQWLNRKGGPVLRLGKVSLKEDDGGYVIDLELRQKGTPYILNIPVVIETFDGRLREEISIKGKSVSKSFSVGSRPLGIEIDPEYDLFRLLDKDEIPPNIDNLLRQSKPIILMPDTNNTGLVEIGRYLKRRFGFRATGSAGLKGFKHRSLIILGGPDINRGFELIKDSLPDGVKIGEDGFSIKGMRYGRDNLLLLTLRSGKNVYGVFTGEPAVEQARSIARRISHYGRYSYLVFDRDGKVMAKGIFEGEKPLRYIFESPE